MNEYMAANGAKREALLERIAEAIRVAVWAEIAEADPASLASEDGERWTLVRFGEFRQHISQLEQLVEDTVEGARKGLKGWL